MWLNQSGLIASGQLGLHAGNEQAHGCAEYGKDFQRIHINRFWL
jgi:hypothetical protein